MMKQKHPVGIILISLIFYISAVVEIIFAALCFLEAGIIKPFLSMLGIFGAGIFFCWGGVFLFFGLLDLLTAIGLSYLKRWAEIAAISISIFGILSSMWLLTNRAPMIYAAISLFIIDLVVIMYFATMRGAFPRRLPWSSTRL